MSKLALILSLSLFASLAACMENGSDLTSTTAQSVTEMPAELVVAGDPCGDKLAADNNACIAAYNSCLASAQTRLDRIACWVSLKACQAAAAVKYYNCVLNQGAVPAQPAPAPVPATDPAKLGWLDVVVPGPFASVAAFDAGPRLGCGTAG